jgi:hypothetical protein
MEKYLRSCLNQVVAITQSIKLAKAGADLTKKDTFMAVIDTL